MTAEVEPSSTTTGVSLRIQQASSPAEPARFIERGTYNSAFQQFDPVGLS